MILIENYYLGIFDKRDGLKFYIDDYPVKINNAGELYDIIKKNEESN